MADTERSIAIYRKIQEWLAGQNMFHSSGVHTIEHDGVKMRFKKISTMSGDGRRAQSLDQDDFSITYDPNWNVLGRIEALAVSLTPPPATLSPEQLATIAAAVAEKKE